jgi:hypothetical protein
LKEEGRELFAFYLIVDSSAAIQRAKNNDARQRGVTTATLRASEELHRSCPEVLDFATTAGLPERRIDTSRMTKVEVADAIHRYIGTVR